MDKNNITRNKMFSGKNASEVFGEVFVINDWSSTESRSGMGSTLEYTINTRKQLPLLWEAYDINKVVDIGCGDFYIGPSIYDSLDISYTGYDVYKKVIDYLSKKYQKQKKYNFVHSDVTNDKENIKNADLCILKDVVQHWELSDIYSFLDYIIKHKKFKYILLCNSLYTSDTTGKEIRTGDYKPRSCEHLPLSKYNPKKLYNYGDKEVSYISLENETNL